MVTLEELIDHHKEFAQNVIKNARKFVPQIVISVDNDINVFTLVGHINIREEIKKIIQMIEISNKKPDWVVVMSEGYMETVKLEDKDKLKNRGSLEQRYLNGDTNIIWVFQIQVYTKEGKKMVVYGIKNLELIKLYEDDKFGGCLTINW